MCVCVYVGMFVFVCERVCLWMCASVRSTVRACMLTCASTFVEVVCTRVCVYKHVCTVRMFHVSKVDVCLCVCG